MADTPLGGLNAVAPPKPAAPTPQPQGQTPNVGMNAARVASMEDTEAPQENFAAASLRKLAEERQAMKNQIDLLTKSVDVRQNRMFDPVLMKAASGFLRPTKTGSFGESLGYASDMMADEAEKEAVREQAAVKMRQELMEKKMALNKQDLMSQFTANRLGYGQQTTLGTGIGQAPVGSASAPTPGGAPSAAPSAAPANAPQGGGTAVTMTGAPRKTQMITDEDIAIAYDLGGKEFGDALREQAKLQREDVKDMGGRPYSLSQQKFLEANPDQIVEADFGRLVGTKKVPYKVYQEWENIKNKGDATGNPNLELDWFRKKNWIDPQAGVGNRPIETPAEEKIRLELDADRIKRQNEEESKKIGQLDTSFLTARKNINTANDMISMSKTNPRAFELLNNTGIASAIGRALNTGVNAGNVNIKLPIQELSTYKLTKEDRDALTLYLQGVAKLQVQSRKLIEGQGSITESEGRLTNEMQALPNDTARVIRLKSEALILDSRFDQEVHKAWTTYTDKNPSGTFRKFLQSPELEKIRNHYDQQADTIRKNNADLLGNVNTKKTEAPKVVEPAPVTASPIPTQPTAPKVEPPKAESSKPSGGVPSIKGPDDPVYRNLPQGGIYKDVDGIVKRKK
jgi:hypothetical protein